MNTAQRLSQFVCGFVLLLTFGGTTVSAQSEFGGFDQSGDVFGDVNFGELGFDNGEPTTWSAKYFADGDIGRIEIEVSIGSSWHVYSATQPPGGPLPTRFSIASPDAVSIEGDFEPNEAPESSVSETYPGIQIEEHVGVVRWSAPISLPSEQRGSIKVKVKALACQTGGSCMPIDETLVATYAGPLPDDSGEQPAATVGKAVDQLTKFLDDGYAVRWEVGVSSSIAAGEQGRLVLRAIPEKTFHVYHAVVDDSRSATNFVVTEKAGFRIGAPTTKDEIISKSLFAAIPGVDDAPPIRYHKGTVTWELPIEVPAETPAGEYKVEGYVAYQACTDTSCLGPKALKFIATVLVADKTKAMLQPVEVQVASTRTATDLAGETTWVDEFKVTSTADVNSSPPATRGGAAPKKSSRDGKQANGFPAGAATRGGQLAETQDDFGEDAFVASPESNTSFGIILLMAFGGGVILNLMPCVLPVVGIKIMSFVQQAGEDRKRVFALNFAYSAGILAVFALLAVLAAAFSFKWGQQFQLFELRLGLTVLIFAMALSYLGVWELPTPGVVSSDASQNLQDREDLTGAFFKGTFATVLATPCSGPMLGTVFGVTGGMGSTEKAIVFLTIGLGMAIPYVILGLYPSAVRMLPKPGEWMVTLKEFLAFMFLGTVAYFFNQFRDGQKLAVFVTLIGVWFGCWVIGKVPPWEVLQKKIRGYTVGVGSAVAIGWLAFGFLVKVPPPVDLDNSKIQYIVDKHLKWEPYSEARLQALQEEGKTVMLDFTAAWCPNCIYNKKTALDTQVTSKLIAELDAVAMLADWTDENDEIKEKLDQLESESIPILAIYPGSRPDKPIVLRDVVSQNTVLKALRSAGPSRASDSVAVRNVKGTATEQIK
ncbi:MAG: thioredoxin family protein [Planctomycetota bacterium]